MAAAARTHDEALRGWYAAQTNPLTVYDAAGPTGPVTGPYAVVYSNPGDRMAPTMGLQYRRVTTSHQLSLFGGTTDEVLWAADKAAEILGATLTVTGRRMEPVRFLGSTPVTRDDATRNSSGQPLFTAVMDVAVTSNPDQ